MGDAIHFEIGREGALVAASFHHVFKGRGQTPAGIAVVLAGAASNGRGLTPAVQEVS
jgi:hypothetical protein